MRPGFWRKMLSYFTDVHIESTSSPWNPLLQVCLSRGRYQLCTSGAIYSYEDLYSNFFMTFAVLHSGYEAVFPHGPTERAGQMYAFEEGRQRSFAWGERLFDGQSVLLLGLGLGSVPWMLERNFGLELHYTAVEIDEVVIALAQKYALSELHSPMEVIQANALLFVQQDERQYDLVIMDVFQDAVVPASFQRLSFLEALKNRLSPNGILLFNFLAQTPSDRLHADRFFRNKFLQVFPRGDYLDTGGNRMLLAEL